MKYKILQKLPGMEVGTIIEGDKLGNIILPFGYTNISNIEEYPDFFEEVKEPKTIYDLKKGDEIWVIHGRDVIKNEAFAFAPYAHINVFLTEREAKRNKLLRELATRMDKWLPKKGDYYNTYGEGNRIFINEWDGGYIDIINYNLGFVFRDELEYDKWITEEAKDLLFKL